jgi:carbamate kinase
MRRSRVVVALGGNALLCRGERAEAETQRAPVAAPIDRATPRELRSLSFAAGSMGPKVEAACRFVERTGNAAAIGALAELSDVLAGRAGTQVAPELVAA